MKNSLLVPKALLKSSWLLVVLLVFLSACVGPVAAPQPGLGSPEASSAPAGESQAYPATAVPTKEESAQAQAAETSPSPEAEGPSQRLDPLEIQKYSTLLFIMPVMPPVSSSQADQYEVAVRQFSQQVLPADLPATTVWGYGKAGDPLPETGRPSSFHWPAYTFDLESQDAVTVKWVNHLVKDPDAEEVKFLPPLLPVDQSLVWANPSGSEPNAEAYTGPVPILPYLHGAQLESSENGNPEAWFLPAADDLPEDIVTSGPQFYSLEDAEAGEAIYEYSNDQRGGILWYHDQALGLSRLNDHAGLKGYWLLHDADEAALNLPSPHPKLGDAPGTRYYDIPLAIEDRSFNEDGSFAYPVDSEGEPSPAWTPGFYGDTIVANGNTWPFLEVEPRLYRFRVLNASNTRTLLLRFDVEGFTFHQIGADGGLLPHKPIELDELLLAPAERADILVDFTRFKSGVQLKLLNFGPDGPFIGLPVPEEDVANPETTGQVMQFKVIDLTEDGVYGEVPDALPRITRLETELPARELILVQSAEVPGQVMLGTLAEGPLAYADPETEQPKQGDVEVWNLINLTGEAHAIHIGGYAFQVRERVPIDGEALLKNQEAYLAAGNTDALPNLNDYLKGEPEDPAPAEMGWKDTVIAYPNMVTRIIIQFDRPGAFFWQTQLLEFQDKGARRSFSVGAE